MATAAAPKEEPALPAKVQVGASPVYIVGHRLGKGGFGQVSLGTRAGRPRAGGRDPKPAEVALKFEHRTSKGCTPAGPPHEWSVYAAVGEAYGVPRLHFRGAAGEWYVMVLDRLGPSLWDRWSASGQAMPAQLVACVAVEALAILRALHARGWVHGDVKPENFLLGAPGSASADRLFLVDFGLAQRWRDAKSGAHARYDQRPDDFRGTIRYASVHAHMGRTPARRDDLESLAYTLLFLLAGRLPWQGYQGEHKGYAVARKKMSTSAEALARHRPPPFRAFAEAVAALRFDEEPPYAELAALFAPLCGPAGARPLQVDAALAAAAAAPGAAGRKRPRGDGDADGDADGAAGGDADGDADDAAPSGLLAELASGARKRARLGFPAAQWVSVFSRRPPMKQRYHYNVSSARLSLHLAKGYDDGLRVSCACACADLWAVVMDAGTGYSAQVYHTAAKAFLPKDWVTEHWDRGYYITSVAGSASGGALVVMSKGTHFTQQSYKVSDAFPYEWIKKKWREEFSVTAIATAGSQWAVVMSRGAGLAAQVVELDFQYPSEGIHRRWDAGFRITAVGATPDQTAVVLSAPRRAADAHEVQETLRTSAFPGEHVKAKWAGDLYLAGIAYGRTVS